MFMDRAIEVSVFPGGEIIVLRGNIYYCAVVVERVLEARYITIYITRDRVVETVSEHQ